MPYVPSPQLLKAKDEYDKAIARYNDWVFSNPNLGCYKTKLSAIDIVTNNSKLAGCSWDTCGAGLLPQCQKEVDFINNDVIPDLINKFKSFDSLAKADPNYNQYVKDESTSKAIKTGIIIIVIASILTGLIILAKKYNLISKLKSAIKQ